MKNSNPEFKKIVTLSLFVIAIILVSCSGADKIKEFNESMKKISETTRKIDSFNLKVSKGATKFSKHMEKYMDTTIWYKDSNGTWNEKANK